MLGEDFLGCEGFEACFTLDVSAVGREGGASRWVCRGGSFVGERAFIPCMLLDLCEFECDGLPFVFAEMVYGIEYNFPNDIYTNFFLNRGDLFQDVKITPLQNDNINYTPSLPTRIKKKKSNKVRDGTIFINP